MEFATPKFTRRLFGAIVLMATQLSTLGCGESDRPGYTAPSTPPAAPAESIAGKKPKDAENVKPAGGRLGGGGRPAAGKAVTGLAPAGP